MGGGASNEAIVVRVDLSRCYAVTVSGIGRYRASAWYWLHELESLILAQNERWRQA